MGKQSGQARVPGNGAARHVQVEPVEFGVQQHFEQFALGVCQHDLHHLEASFCSLTAGHPSVPHDMAQSMCRPHPSRARSGLRTLYGEDVHATPPLVVHKSANGGDLIISAQLTPDMGGHA